MSIKARLDGFDKQLKLAAAQLSRASRLPLEFVIINDPEEGLEAFRLDDWDPMKTIEIGSMIHSRLDEAPDSES